MNVMTLIKLREIRKWRWLALIPLIGAVCSGSGSRTEAQPINLSVRAVNGKASVFWPAGLKLVQPEFKTNLATGLWQDLGNPTESTNLVDGIASGSVFYRLRFLAPRILTQPAGLSLAAGGSVSLNVAATGTAPLTYQWRKDGVNLSRQAGIVFSLNAASGSDTAGYSVVVANSVGAVTSVVAVVTVTNAAPAMAPQGIYIGNFAGQTNGGFAALIRTNGPGIVLAHQIALAEGLFGTNIAVAADGGFAMLGENLGKAAGKIGPETVEGTLTSTNGAASAFSAARKAGTGIHQASAGFYAGTFDGLFSGSAYVILAADGTAFTYLTAPSLGVVSTFGTVDSANSLAATAAYTLPGTTIPSPIQITGTLTPATHAIAGTYSLSGIRLGSFSLARSVLP